MANKVYASFTEDGERIKLAFDWTRELYVIVESLPGRTFVPREKSKTGDAYWTVPKDIAIARHARKLLTNRLVLDAEIKAWAHEHVKRERNMLAVNNAETATLHTLPHVLPELHEFVATRPYQLADIAFMAAANNPLNANAPGLGKTVETIGAIFESGLGAGQHLIVAPLTSMEVVWWYELDRWQPYDMLMSIGSATARHEVIMDAVHMAKEGTPFFLIINPAQLRGKDAAHIMATNWTTVTVDEFHKCGLSNPKTATSAALHALKAQKRIALSGTPIGGKVARLWAVLNWLEQETFKSKWNWIKTWLETQRGYGGSLEAGEIKRWKQDEFNEYHAQFMVRRLREEVRTELPEKQRMDIWVTLDDPEQRKQYEDFARAAEIRIEEENLSATSILAEYTRLRQFAIAKQRLVKERTNHRDGTRTEFITPYPTTTSCKLPQVQRILDEQGCFEGDEMGKDENGKRKHAQVIIFSQFSKVVDMVCDWLIGEGMPEAQIGRITGDVSERERGPIIKKFEAGETYRVLAMTTTAGGVSITLNESDAIIFLDETFNPDDQTQAEDRNRENSAELYYIRTKGTIEEYVYSITRDKLDTNWNVLDLRRLGLRADREADSALAGA